MKWCLLIFIFPQLAIAKLGPTPINIKEELSAIAPLNVYDADTYKKRKLSELTKLKLNEYQRQWKDCVKMAPKVLAQKRDLAGWIHTVWLNCAVNASIDGKTISPLIAAVDSVKNEKELFYRGPWRQDLFELWLKVQFKLIENSINKNRLDALRRLDQVFAHLVLMNKDEKARVYDLQGDFMGRAKREGEALHFYRLAYELNGQKSVLDKIIKIDPKFMVKNNEVLSQALDSQQPEYQFDQEVQIRLKKSDIPGAQVLMLQYLMQYPHGFFAKRYKDKVIENYLAAWEKRNEGVSHQILSELLQADESRLSEWLQLLHRRGDYAGALAMADKVLAKRSASSQASQILWVAGRCAHFLGQYERAIFYFDQLVQQHSASEESLEARFRMGLIQFRLGHVELASRLFDQLLRVGRDRFELQARYWLVRSLEKNQPERFIAERDVLIEKFPFSYYGLRLKAEKNNFILEAETDKEKSIEQKEPVTWVVGEQKETWLRLKKLISAGWLLEAQVELEYLNPPQDSFAQMAWAKKLAEYGLYLPAIMLSNKGFENSIELRRFQIAKSFLPRAYVTTIQTEAKKYELSPMLIFSLIRQESAFSLRAKSTSNALGLMQMIPSTAQEVALKLKMKVQIPEEMFRPEINIPMGVSYIAQVIDEFSGNIPMGLAAYNAGPTRLRYWLEARPEVKELQTRFSNEVRDEIWFDELPWSETSFYVKAILRNTLLYRLMDEGRADLKKVFWIELRDKKTLNE